MPSSFIKTHKLFQNQTFSDKVAQSRAPHDRTQVKSNDNFVKLFFSQFLSQLRKIVFVGRDVFVLFAAPVGYDSENETNLSPIVDLLLEYPNIHFRNINLTRFFSDPLVYDFVFKENRLFTANFGKYQVSNLLRLMILYRYGGVYIDMDFIIKSGKVQCFWLFQKNKEVLSEGYIPKYWLKTMQKKLNYHLLFLLRIPRRKSNVFRGGSKQLSWK